MTLELFCASCGNEVSEILKFCPACGALSSKEKDTQDHIDI